MANMIGTSSTTSITNTVDANKLGTNNGNPVINVCIINNTFNINKQKTPDRD